MAVALARTGREILSMLDSPELLDGLCRLTTELLQCDYSHVLLWDPRDDAYVLVSSHGDQRAEWGTTRLVRIPRGTFAGLLNQLERDGVARADAGSTVVASSLPPQCAVMGDLYTALGNDGTVIGILTAGHHRRGRPFTPQQEQIALGIGELSTLALEHSRVVQDLIHANRLKLDFVATMSHQLRTPLHVIIGYNDLLLEGGFGELSPEQQDTLRRVSERARELLELIKSTLELSQLESGGLSLEVREIDVTKLVAELDRELRSDLTKPGVRFVWQLAGTLSPVHTDAAKLTIVLRQLIDNALKFTDQGSVTVDVHPRNDGIEFSVTDTGIGMAAEDLPHIFDPFWRNDALDPGRHVGVGLGLYAVRRLLDVLGGKITVSSEFGHGSTFRAWVPLLIPRSVAPTTA